jgi:ribonuclease HI
MSSARPHYLLFAESMVDSATLGSWRGAQHGRWKFVLEAVDGEQRIEASDEEEDCPPDRLELLAVVRGLEALPHPSRVTLITGSRYVSRGLRFGLDQWREDGWQWERFGEMSPINHADLWQRVDRALKIHDVHCRTMRIDTPETVSSPLASPQGRVRTQRPAPSGVMREYSQRAGEMVRGFLRGAPVRAAQLL